MGAFLGVPRPSLPLCSAVREGRFCGVCLVVVALKLQDQEQQPEQEQKGAKTWPKDSKSISFQFLYWCFRRDVRHSLGAFSGLPRRSLPLCFAVREGRFCGVCLVAGVFELKIRRGSRSRSKKEPKSGQKHQFQWRFQKGR